MKASTRHRILQRDEFTCQTCGGRATEIDHIWPRYWGGEDCFSNLQAICGPCNKRKGTTVSWLDASEWQLVLARQAVTRRLRKIVMEAQNVIDFAGVQTEDVAFRHVSAEFLSAFSEADADVTAMVRLMLDVREAGEHLGAPA